MHIIRILRMCALGASLSLNIGCGKGSSFSLLSDSESFTQSADIINNKVDILWIIDSSGTMENHQNNLGNNFAQFIDDFVSKDVDYHMAIGSTDAWVREANYNSGGCVSSPNPGLDPNKIYISSSDCAKTKAQYKELTYFRDGDIYGPRVNVAGLRSGVYMLTSLMDPEFVKSTFSINAKVGTRGDGKETGFSSLRALLRRNEDGSVGYNGETHTSLEEFRRPDAFFAVILVSDEEDQSLRQNRTAYGTTEEYVNDFVDFLDAYTASEGGSRRYSISSVVVTDVADCTYSLNGQASKGNRYIALSEATNGVVANICSSDFASEVNAVSEKILSLTSRFKLSRKPIPETLDVRVNGVAIYQSETSGWTYVEEGTSYFLEFHGSSIPPQGSLINVYFDPVGYGI